ncbi:MAG: S-layer homology domain-containing protein, partial [Clostridiales bacterium]|nr:S-layer homology domain-containing protein [Clostridiales bacterium]
VDTDSWAYAIVEAAKAYLTGYKSSDGTMYFYGSKEAVREDMAVALVKALGLTVQSNDTALAAAFTDYDDISEALRDYVYTAYVEGIMKGSDGEFNPQGGLTRAEAAVLIQRALQTAEKVVVDDSDTSDKVVVGD